MRDRLRFLHDAALDVVESFSDQIVLNSAADVDEWASHVSEALAQYGKKVWLLINLDGLVVRPTASASFGKRRAEVLQRFACASVRYGGDPWTLVSITTSAARHDTHGNVFPTRDEALRFLLALRDELEPQHA